MTLRSLAIAALAVPLWLPVPLALAQDSEDPSQAEAASELPDEQIGQHRLWHTKSGGATLQAHR